MGDTSNLFKKDAQTAIEHPPPPPRNPSPPPPARLSPQDNPPEIHTQPAPSLPPPALPAPGLYTPTLTTQPTTPTSITDIAASLMSPPQWLYSPDGTHVTLTITWAVGVAGPERFMRTALNRRHALLQDDDLYLRGGAVGLSEEVRAWLRSGADTLRLPAGHFL